MLQSTISVEVESGRRVDGEIFLEVCELFVFVDDSLEGKRQ